jgi:hypothetical protein
MKREKTTQRFDWSRNPSREGVHSVYIATPGSYASYGKEITREEMANSLSTWNRINELNAKKAMFKTLFIATLVSIPFIAIIYNMVSTIMQNPK